MAFKARFTGGKCVSCNETVQKGQEITWNRKGEKSIRHVSCSGSASSSATLCGSCGHEFGSNIYACNRCDEYNAARINGTNGSGAPCKVCGYELGSSLTNVNGRDCSDCREYHEKQQSIIRERKEPKTQLITSTQEKTEEISDAEIITETKTEIVSTGNAALDLLAAELLPRLNGKLTADFSNIRTAIDKQIEDNATKYAKQLEETVLALIESSAKTVRLEIKTGDEIITKDAGVQHKQFPILLKMMNATDHKAHRLNIWIAGPAGTGKTSAAEKAAEVLGLDFASTGALTESYKIFGFIAPGTGVYVPTPFRKIWEFGGVFLFDDCDGSDPTVLVELNNALANGGCTFPDGYVKRHKDCVLILTANTWGHGATNEYVGRMKQDAAFLDRFPARIFWDIDEDLELATAPDTKWTKRVQQVRANVKAKGVKVLVTPRASYGGAALLAAGLSWEETEASALKGAMTLDQWNSVK
jgi:cobaltochelatase CobS